MGEDGCKYVVQGMCQNGSLIENGCTFFKAFGRDDDAIPKMMGFCQYVNYHLCVSEQVFL